VQDERVEGRVGVEPERAAPEPLHVVVERALVDGREPRGVGRREGAADVADAAPREPARQPHLVAQRPLEERIEVARLGREEPVEEQAASEPAAPGVGLGVLVQVDEGEVVDAVVLHDEVRRECDELLLALGGEPVVGPGRRDAEVQHLDPPAREALAQESLEPRRVGRVVLRALDGRRAADARDPQPSRRLLSRDLAAPEAPRVDAQVLRPARLRELELGARPVAPVALGPDLLAVGDRGAVLRLELFVQEALDLGPGEAPRELEPELRGQQREPGREQREVEGLPGAPHGAERRIVESAAC
jgi:hypothetical protein